jgi:PAS domain S-box-containing protein
MAEQKLKNLERIFEITTSINSRVNLSEILNALADAVSSEIVQADLVGIFLKKKDGTYQGHTANKLPVDITELIIDPANDRFARTIISNKTSEYIPDTSVDTRPDAAKINLLKIKSILGIPVIVKGEVFGLLFIHDFGKAMNLTVEQIEVTETFVKMACVAIQNFTELKNTQQRYRSLLEKSMDTIIITRNGICEYINQSGLSLLGLSNDKEIVGQSLYPFINPEDHKSFVDQVNFTNSDSNGGGQTNQRWVRSNGDLLEVEVIAIPLFEHNDTTIQLIVRDTTEKKNMEELIFKSKKLSVVGQLAAGIAHEIRNPLTSLMGFTKLIRESGNAEEDYLQIMTSELSRIESIVSELLVLAKPQVTNFKLLSIKDLLTSVSDLLITQAIINNISLEIECEPAIPLIKGDKNQLMQVFINIIKNAIEAMPNGGMIKIEGKNNLSGVVVSILDQGVGITPEKIKRIGEPFYTTKEKGTGLGMMVSYKIIESHKAELHIQSEVNRGTKIEVTFQVE